MCKRLESFLLLYFQLRWVELMAAKCQVREHGQLVPLVMPPWDSEGGTGKPQFRQTHTLLLQHYSILLLFFHGSTTTKAEWACGVSHSGSVCVHSGLFQCQFGQRKQGEQFNFVSFVPDYQMTMNLTLTLTVLTFSRFSFGVSLAS